MNEPHFVTTRVFDVPRSVLFQAFVEPDVLARWWGPAGFTNTFEEFTPAPGHVWRFVMHAPDGATYPMANEFVEVAQDERIVLRHQQPGHDFRLEMIYEDGDAPDRSRLTWRMWFDSPEEAERVRPFVPAANEQNFDRLAAEVAPMRQAEA